MLEPRDGPQARQGPRVTDRATRCRLVGALAGWSEAAHCARVFRLELQQMAARSQVTLLLSPDWASVDCNRP